MSEAESGWLLSLLFWLALLIAAVLYGIVALAPKLQAYLQISREFYDNQVRLVTLQRQTAYLERVTAALEHDPQFAAELARIDFDAARPGEERIPVESHLSLGGRAIEPAPAAVPARLPWYYPAVAVVAENRAVRRNLLIAAGVVVVGAFTFLQTAVVSSTTSLRG